MLMSNDILLNHTIFSVENMPTALASSLEKKMSLKIMVPL